MMKLDHLDVVVWVQTAFPGDIVLTTAAIKWLKERAPAIEQIIVTTPVGGEILDGHPDLSRVIVYNKKKQRGLLAMAKAARTIKKAVAGRRAVLLRPHLSYRSGFLSILTGLPSVTFEESNLSTFSSARVVRPYFFHETMRISALMGPLLENGEALPEMQRPYLPEKPLTESLEKALNIADGQPLIGLAPGSVWATKRYPSLLFAESAKLILQKNPSAYLVLLWAPSDLNAAKEIMARSDTPERIINTIGETRMQDLQGLIPRLRVLLCNDSAPIHYASAFNIPTVAIFGATIPEQGFGPLAANSSVLQQSSLQCRPCGDHGHKSCPLGHFQCMRAIEPAEAARAVQACF